MFFLWCCCSATILTFSFLGLRDPLSFNSWSYGWIRDIWIFSDIIWLQGKTCCFVFHNLKCNDFLVTSPKSYEGMHMDGLQNATFDRITIIYIQCIFQTYHIQQILWQFLSKKRLENVTVMFAGQFFCYATTNDIFFLNRASLFGKIFVFLGK